MRAILQTTGMLTATTVCCKKEVALHLLANVL